ncbi:hypothetical protein [Kitasatospora sp. NPDC057500]|uniref:hypothetical protein n=1 Tax=Kitasatospora sp. NPDC057500 TaxID=3346151 RepID=UPI0036944261
MKYDILQIAGAALTVLGAQGTIRLLLDHGDTGLLGRLPGGFAAALAGHLLALVAGVLLAGWSHSRAKALGRRG